MLGGRGADGSVVIELGDGLADGGLIQELFLVNQAGHTCPNCGAGAGQGGGTDLIDAARHPLGVLEDARHRVVGEQWPGRVTGRAHVMPDIAEGLGQIKRTEVIAHRQSLAKGFMNCQVEGAAQIRMANQDDGGQRLAASRI